eukprot:TRINITY_DN27428_c0_g1_i1.p1 TRINITY_DN27428_c0_g1~~TRINITY_DN27428_c0_g1_i1.p1  ORF type:complete len:690 (+),score=266.48 TRINITY_DN27428_c0_g1_i1:53-2122(+)
MLPRRASTLAAPARWRATAPPRGQNLVEKLVQKYAVDGEGAAVEGLVYSGEFVSIKPHKVMTHDNTSAVMPKFKALWDGGAGKVRYPEQLFFGIDHDVQNVTPENLKKYDAIEAFAKEQGVAFTGAGAGIVHQVMVENGMAFPGTLVVASDSHSNMYGGIGCLGTPVVRTDAAALWATGQTWWTIPKVTRVELVGTLPEGCSGKDVIITLCAGINADEVLNHAIEFAGAGVAELSVDDRLTVANMTTEWGALAGVFPVDAVLLDWLRGRASAIERRSSVPRSAVSAAAGNFDEARVVALEAAAAAGDLAPDADAVYAQEITLDLSKVTPCVSGPNSVKKMTPAAEFKDKAIQKAYLVSCTNSRASDIAAAAEVLAGKKVAPGVELYVAPASDEVRVTAEAEQTWQVLLDAGAIPLPAGCGPCVGLGMGLLQEGEAGISASNRNFKGRMGHPKAECYLASPAVVAASAVAGRITHPAALTGKGVAAAGEPAAKIASNAATPPAGSVALREDFPATLSGNLVYLHEDNLNTDGIYAGKHTYSHLEPPAMAQVAMENYDPAFGELYTPGDIVVGGYNFGSGSSREQAATCLKYKGVPLIIAGSFSQTYQRNAFNNGLAVLESPALVEYLRAAHPTPAAPTVATGRALHIDFATATATYDGRAFPVSPLGPFAQEICLVGGLESWVRTRLAAA